MFELIFVSALVLSLIFCATPGAVNTEAIRVGVAGGFRRSFGVEMGSIVGDTTWAMVALIGLAFVWENDAARLILGVLGSGILLYLAYRGFQDARKGELPEGPAPSGRSDFMTGVLISFVNPLQLAFWIGIGSTAIAVIIPDPQFWDLAAFYLGYFVGAIIFGVTYSALIGYGRKYVTPRLFQVISLICALALTYFAITLLLATFF